MMPNCVRRSGNSKHISFISSEIIRNAMAELVLIKRFTSSIETFSFASPTFLLKIVGTTKMNYNPRFFGSSYWTTLHTACASATTEAKRDAVYQMIMLWKTILPCEKCRKHYIKNLQDLPPGDFMKSNQTLFYWSWKLHDMVNELTHKPIDKRWSYQRSLEFYGMSKSPVVVQAAIDQGVCSEDCTDPPAVHQGRPVRVRIASSAPKTPSDRFLRAQKKRYLPSH